MKKRSYIVLALLFLILAFIGGARYGQRVEQVNETISFIVSITPVQITTTPQPIDNFVKYNQYTHAGCSLRFLYPDILSVKDSSISGTLKEEKAKNVQITFECSSRKDVLDKKVDLAKVSTVSAQFQKRNLQMYKREVNKQNYFVFNEKHPYKNMYIQYTVKENILSLLEKTLEYVR